MKSKTAMILNITLGLMLLLSAFVYANHDQYQVPSEPNSYVDEWTTKEDEQDVVLTIWSPKPFLDYEIQSFQEANPNIRIEFTSLHDEPRLSERYLNALAEGTAPDILLLTQTMLGSINSVDLIADLSESHLDLKQYRHMMGEYMWNIHQSLDGDRTIALPMEAYPYVFYYRYDIMEEIGYPSEPKELADYLRDPNHLLQLASDLKQSNRWALQWDNDLITVVNSGRFIFNRDIEYERSSEFYRQVIDTTLKFKDLAANVSIWNQIGQEMLRSGQLAMVIMPSYGEGNLVEWLPDQAGKWRATSLPLGIEAVDIHTSLSLAITEHSKHKSEAEQFVKYVMDTSTVFNWYTSSPASEFLGGQDSGKLYLDILKNNSSREVPTPLDGRLFDVWFTSVEQSRRSGYSIEDTLNAATQDVMDISSIEQEQLRLYLQRSSQ